MTFHEDMKHWIWLQRAAGKGANLERLLSPFGGDVRALYEADPKEREALLRESPSEADGLLREEARSAGARGGWTKDGWRSDGQEVLAGWQSGASAFETSKQHSKKRRPVAESTLRRMKSVSLAEAEDVLALCERTGIVPLCPADDYYPWLLREIPSFPAVLYALGDVRLLTPSTLPFAIVGARDARLTSLSAASDLASSLARAGFLIVSGGAIGTDSACHIGALNAGCPTVAVLGTGIGTRYLQQNADLRRVISHNGLLLSEMEPGEPGSRGSFPLRNRIIAGMSVGTLVVEAAVKSGSLITSKYAEEFDRDVFVPLFPGIDPGGTLAAAFPSYAAPPAPTNPAPAPRPSVAPATLYAPADSAEFADTGVPTNQAATPEPQPSVAPATSPAVACPTAPGAAHDAKLEVAFRGTRELLLRETGVGIRCAADIIATYAGSYGLDPDVLVASGQVPAADLTRDVTDLAGVFPPLLSRSMVAKARAQLGLRPAGPATGCAFSADSGHAPVGSAPRAGTQLFAGGSALPDGALSDLAGEGTLNPNPGWGPYRTADDAELRVYTSSEFAYRRGDHPHARPSEDVRPDDRSAEGARPAVRHGYTDGALALSEDAPFDMIETAEENNKRTAGNKEYVSHHKNRGELYADTSEACAGRSPQGQPTMTQKPLKTVKDLSQEARLVLGCFRPDRESSSCSAVCDEANKDGAGKTGKGREPDEIREQGIRKSLYYDDITTMLDMAPQYLLAALTELSLAGYLDLTADQRYICAVDLEEVWSAA